MKGVNDVKGKILTILAIGAAGLLAMVDAWADNRRDEEIMDLQDRMNALENKNEEE